MDVTKDWKVVVGNDSKITTFKNIDIKTEGNTRIGTTGNLDIKTDGNAKIGTTGNFDLDTKSANKFTAGATTDILSGGNHTETAAIIHMNGPAATPAASAENAVRIAPLNLHENILTNTSVGWTSNKYQAGTITSIMKRVPMHEPWALHENLTPENLKPSDTDREI
jgi:hypothetical protein